MQRKQDRIAAAAIEESKSLLLSQKLHAEDELVELVQACSNPVDRIVLAKKVASRILLPYALFSSLVHQVRTEQSRKIRHDMYDVVQNFGLKPWFDSDRVAESSVLGGDLALGIDESMLSCL